MSYLRWPVFAVIPKLLGKNAHHHDRNFRLSIILVVYRSRYIILHIFLVIIGLRTACYTHVPISKPHIYTFIIKRTIITELAGAMAVPVKM